MSQVAEARAGSDEGSSYDGLRLRGLTKEFANFTAVKSLDLDVPSGSFFALLGPSGCGKTTTLRMVAGLETPTSGTIELSGKDITWEKPYRRPVNTVFQNYALFPHLDIFENVAFGLRRRKSSDVDQQVRDMLELVELESQVRKRPTQLSGGQQQRVALARALINRPEVLLLDEPLGALDLKLRRSMQIEIKRIQTEVGLTFVHVTHDQEEAMTMADTIAVMNRGVIEQMGAPAELYDNPQTTFVANFLGQSNLIEGIVRGRDGDSVVVDMQGTLASIPADRSHVSGTDGEKGWVGIRPEKVLIGAVGEEIDAPGNSIPGGVVSDVSFVGREHPVPRPDAVGPGDPGLRAEHRSPPVLPAGRGGRHLLATGVRLPARPQPGRLGRRGPGGRGARDRRPTRPLRRRPPGTPRRRRRRRKRVAHRLLAAAARGAVAVRLLRHPVLLTGGHQPLRPRRLRAAGLRHDLGLRQLRGRDPGVLAAAGALALVRRHRHRDLPGARLRARLRDRLQGGPVEEPDAGAGDRAVLHQLPGADPVVEAAPGATTASSSTPCSSCT